MEFLGKYSYFFNESHNFKHKVAYRITFFIFRRGSPLLVGIKSKASLATDYIPVLYSKGI